MATSVTSQSILSNPITCAVHRTNGNKLISYISVSRQQRRIGTMQVRCMVDQDQDLITPPAPKKVSPKFSDLLAFSGPAPERINGRFAMTGFVAAIAVELVRGDDLVAQLTNGGVPWFVGTSVLLSLASLVPLFKGVSVESKSDEVMTSSTEMWKGRFAMIGLVALVLTEYVNGAAFV
ncbi:hypothetical protein GIB67_027083 [Kingdonia uniflora]|uniref:Early light-induced protein n=1 Tax=Kingdonia uniflora TaxID=39325 RepID=A0A7J7P2J3_9MAGN|nr:hypothetical protein GIB67_027083 [Kingdonia uniflora]